MLMTTRLIEADEALAIGLVNELFDTNEELMARAHAWPRRSPRRRR
jgi:enoyl-CoA hydratase/carnithine racemase